MLKRHVAVINFLRVTLDSLIIAVAWNAAYLIRFYAGLFEHSGIPPYPRHLFLTVPVVIIVLICRHSMRIYQSSRGEPIARQLRRQLESIVLGFVMLVLFLYYSEKAPYTRILLALFAVLLTAALLLSHWLVFSMLHFLRKKGYNQRYYGIIGTGKNALKLFSVIQSSHYFGLNCSFFIDDDPKLEGKILSGVKVYGHLEHLPQLVRQTGVDEIYLAKNSPDIQKLYPILNEIQAGGVTVRILPDWTGLTAISRPSVFHIGSFILLTASESSLTDANIILKDVFDRIAALLLLLLFAVPMVLIGVCVKLTSGGPVFFKQPRVGMDQKTFNILKFRTMKASPQTTGGWTVKDDPRRTVLGRFLRAFSLDELPQLLNVLKGDMSLVGPRPEQPEFVRQFSEDYKKYMFRHKVKSGMTGWAQIHGFRGDSSIRKRTQYDLYYVQHWSIWLDLLILLRTPFHVLRQKNAY